MKSLFPAMLFFIVLLFSCSGILDPDEPGLLVPKTVVDDPALPRVEVNGTVLHAETFGVAGSKVVIFLHDGPGRDYRSLLPLSALVDEEAGDEYFLVFFDQRGSGLSKRHDEDEINMDIYLKDLDAIIDMYTGSPTEKVILFGHGWGAMYATAYINAHPERINGAILSEPYAFTGEQMERIKDDLFNEEISADWYNDLIWSSLLISADSQERKDFQLLLRLKDAQPKLKESQDDPSPVWRLGAVANKAINESLQNSDGKYNFNFTANLNKLNTDVVFIRGELTEVLDLEHHQMLQTFYQLSDLVTINAAGHNYYWINPQEVIITLSQYLSNH